MLGYATPNDASANATFLFDDIEQTVTLSNGDDLLSVIDGVFGYPNPAKNLFKITSKNKILERITLFDIRGYQVLDLIPNKLEASIDVSNFANGIYIAKIATPKGVGSIKLIVE